MQEYLGTRYPALRKQAEDSGTIIYFIDEVSIRSDYHSITTWSRYGVTPTVTKTGARSGINMIEHDRSYHWDRPNALYDHNWPF